MPINFSKVYPDAESYRNALDTINTAIKQNQTLLIDQNGKVSIPDTCTKSIEYMKGFFVSLGCVDHTSTPWLKKNVARLLAYGKKWNHDPSIQKMQLAAAKHFENATAKTKPTFHKIKLLFPSTFTQFLYEAAGAVALHVVISHLFPAQAPKTISPLSENATLCCGPIPKKSEWKSWDFTNLVWCCAQHGISPDCDKFFKQLPKKLIKHFESKEVENAIERHYILPNLGRLNYLAVYAAFSSFNPANRTQNFIKDSTTRLAKITDLYLDSHHQQRNYTDAAFAYYIPYLLVKDTQISRDVVEILAKTNTYDVVEPCWEDSKAHLHCETALHAMKS